MNLKMNLFSKNEPVIITDIHKGQVKGHFRKTATGGIVWVKEHFDARKKVDEHEKWKSKYDEIETKHRKIVDKHFAKKTFRENRKKLTSERDKELSQHNKKEPDIKNGNYVHRDDKHISIFNYGEIKKIRLSEMSQINDHDIIKVLNESAASQDNFTIEKDDLIKLLGKKIKYDEDGDIDNAYDMEKVLEEIIAKKMGVDKDDISTNISYSGDVEVIFYGSVTIGEVLKFDWARKYYETKISRLDDNSPKKGKMLLALDHYQDQLKINKRSLRNIDDIKKMKPSDCPDVPGLNPKFKLYTHQALVLAKLSKMNESLVDLDMGGGKSLVLAADAAIKMGNGEIKKPLICMPTGLIESHVEKFNDYFQGSINIFVFDSKAAKDKNIKKKLSALPNNTIILASYSALGSNFNKDNEENKDDFRNAEILSDHGIDMCTLDESHKIKNKSGSLNRAISTHFSKCKVKRSASGTLISNNPIDLIGQAFFVDNTILGNEKKFKDKYMEKVDGVSTWKDGSLKEMRELLIERGMISVRRSAWAYRMPPRKEKIHSVDLHPKMKIAYKALLDSILDDPEVQRAIAMSGGSEITKGTILAKLSHLETLIGAPEISIHDKERTERHQSKNNNDSIPLLSIAKAVVKGIKSPKIAKVDEIITNHLKDKKNKKVIITCNTHEAKDYILKHMKHSEMAVSASKTGRNADIAEFKKNPDKKILIAVRKGIQEGYDINEANRVISYDQPWSVGDLEQSYARIFRPGQTSQVNIDVIAGEETLEMTKYAKLVSKNHTNRQVTSDFEDDVALETVKMSVKNIKKFNQFHMMNDYQERANSIIASEVVEGKIFTDKHGMKEYKRHGKPLGKVKKPAPVSTPAPVTVKPKAAPKDWHHEIPKNSKSKGMHVKNKKGTIFHVDGHDKDGENGPEWYGRKLKNGVPHGDEFGIHPDGEYTHHTPVKKSVKVKISKNWHSEVPTGVKSKGTVIQTKGGAQYHIDGYDRKHKVWYGRAMSDGKPSGDEFEFSSDDSFGVVKSDLGKSIKVGNVFFMKRYH